MNSTASQQKHLRKEAQVYQRIYNKIIGEVAKYAKERGIKIVRRINRAAQRKKEIETSDPREILRRINQEVIYIESNELDITEDILKRLQPKKKNSSTKSARN